MTIDKFAGMPIEQLADILRPPGSRNPKQYLYVTADDQAVCTGNMVWELILDAIESKTPLPEAVRRLNIDKSGLIRLGPDELDEWVSEIRRHTRDEDTAAAWLRSPETTGRI